MCCLLGAPQDHSPVLMMSENGCDGHQLHGGGADRFTKGGFLEAYQYMDGKLFAGMVVCEFILADEGPGDGECL
jgi:hypothetical protein